MEKASLFEHNEKAYIKLCEALEHNKCATINHATGTGKSFIALKYLFKNNHKKFLYLAPTYPINEQLIKSCSKIGLTPDDINVDTMIYRSLLSLDMEKLYDQYDGFIFDEYHRTGANETYKKIKELKRILEERNDGKKFIGLTATPIRYLDRERNMTDEIFDGVVASRISLSEAMLEELLPVPFYINSKIACRTEFERCNRKVGLLANTEEKRVLEEKLVAIGRQINNGSMDNQEMIRNYIKEKNGKYIVFCNTIRALERHFYEIDKWFKDIGQVKKFKVYSGQRDEDSERGQKKKTPREVNQSNLDKFNAEKDGISILFCVDILNEGVHVDDIDGVILLRKTVSPIIYFQQIGRALSFSGRRKQIKIFDLVNNFGNHNAIDELYEEFEEEIKRKRELEPENIEKYEAVLNKFKIMDETRIILERIKEIKSEVTTEKIIQSKLKYSLDVLTKKVKTENSYLNLFEDEETRMAYATISKYYRYVDNEQFKKLLELDILLPDELAVTYEERLEYLSGFNTIAERESAENSITINEVIGFIEYNGRMPDVKSKDEVESKLAQRYLHSLTNIDEDLIEKLQVTIATNKIKLESFEKILLNEPFSGRDVENLSNLAREFVQTGKILPEYLYKAIFQLTSEYKTQENEELTRILNASDKIEEDERNRLVAERYKKISNVLGFLEENIGLSQAELENTEALEEFRKLKKSDKAYIKKKYRGFKKNQYKSSMFRREGTDILTFCKKIGTINLGNIEDYFSSVEHDRQMYEDMKAVIQFMSQNEGKWPSLESEKDEERELAERFEALKKEEALPEEFLDSQKVGPQMWYSPGKIMYEIATERFKEADVKLVLLKNIEFFNKTGRKPLKNSRNEAEKALAEEYEKKCVGSLSEDKITILNKFFNRKKNLKNTCMAYIDNIENRQSREGR